MRESKRRSGIRAISRVCGGSNPLDTNSRAVRYRAALVALIRRAISIEPRESLHRLRAAAVLGAHGKLAEAKADAQAALALATDDDERKRAQSMLDRLAKM